MRTICITKKVIFDNVKELKIFLSNGGEAFFEDIWGDNVFRIKCVDGKLVINDEALTSVDKDKLSTIYGYIAN